jgi:methionyl aminopeptidase
MTIIKSSDEVEIMSRAGKIVAMILNKLASEVKPGIKTRLLNSIAEDELRKNGAKASFKNYKGYPASLCVSINDEIVHGIPGERILQEGEIVSLDFGAIVQGFHGDAAVTVGVGNISKKAKELLSTTETALMKGIEAAKCGSRMGDISASIQEYAESKGYSVIREYCGHGIGRNLHEDPQVPNFGVRGSGPILREGMTIAIEPMVTTGDWHTEVDKINRWTVRTLDHSLSAHFEHTIAINDSGTRILTVA